MLFQFIHSYLGGKTGTKVVKKKNGNLVRLHWFLTCIIFFDVTIPVSDIYTLRKKKHIPFKPVNLKFSDNLVRVAPNKALQVMGCYFQFFILMQQILQKINETALRESL